MSRGTDISREQMDNAQMDGQLDRPPKNKSLLPPAVSSGRLTKTKLMNE